MMCCDIFCSLALFCFERSELASLQNCDYNLNNLMGKKVIYKMMADLMRDKYD